MENKYFTPDISDLHIGYKCETKVQPYPNWVNTKIIEGEDITFIQEGIWEVRTRYLTKEQIEAEGWNHIGGQMISGGIQNYEKGDIWKDDKQGGFLDYSENTKMLKITTKDGGYNQDGPNISIKFFGYCPSINEFRYITQKILIHENN